MKRILSIRGGGIRGIIPCLVLAKLEQQTGKLSREIFDFVGGTSTGAALTACIVAGVPATEALKVYTEQGPKVFSPTSSIERKAELVLHGHQFNNKVLHQTIVNTLGANSDMAINDSPIPCMITAGNQNGYCWYFVKDSATNAKTTGKAILADAATASCCATTYHAPWKIPDFGYYADGGTVSVADPIYQTCVEAFNQPGKCYGSIIPDPLDVIVLSLGTGYYKPTTMAPPPDGLIQAISWVTGSLVGSSETLAWQAATRQWPGLIYEIDTPLWAAVDEADVSAIARLVTTGQQLASKKDIVSILRM